MRDNAIKRHMRLMDQFGRLAEERNSMLAALKAVLPRLEDWADGLDADEPDAIARDMVRAAIEKAEGR